MRSIVCTMLITALLFQPAIVVAAPQESEYETGIEDVHVRPMKDSFMYRSAVSQPPVLNPGPVPVQIGDETIELAYTDQNGDLYDVQMNLTRGTAKVIKGSSVVGYGVLTPTEIATLREAGQNVAGSAVVEVILVGILLAIVEASITIAYSEYADRRECQRGVIAGNNQIVRDIKACQRQGKSFTIHDSSTATCGAGAGATCN